MQGLTPKQQIFVQEYLIDLNATNSALRAGYSPKTAYSIGQENLKKPEITKALELAMQERSKRTEITQDMVLHELALLAFSNMQDYIKVTPDGTAYADLSKMTRDQAAAIQEINFETYMEKDGEEFKPVKKTKLKLTCKEGPLEKVGKHLGMFKDKLGVDGELIIKVVRDDRK